MAKKGEGEPDVLGALSVLGDSFDVELAAEVSGAEPADLLRALEPAQRAGVIAVQDGTVRFTADARSEAYDRLGPHGQATAHVRAAEVLARLRPRDLAGIAEQRAGGVAVLGLDAAIEALDAAATAAERAFDWEASAGLWRRAAQLAASRHDGRAGPLALRGARALFPAGLFADSLAACREVAAIARATGDAHLLADAGLVVRGIGDRETNAELLELCRDALEGLGDDPVLRSRLVSQVIMLSSEISRVPVEQEEAEENLRSAELLGDPQALVEALHALQMTVAGPLNTGRRLELADRVQGLAEEAKLDDYLAWPLGWRVDVLFQLGHRPALDRAIARLAEYADSRNDALATWRAQLAWGNLAQHEGRWEEALGFAAEALRLANRGSHQSGDFQYRILVSQVRIKTGTGPHEEALLSMRAEPDAFNAYFAMAAWDAGDIETAAALFELALPSMAEVNGSPLQVPTHCAFAMVAWALVRADTAPAIYAALEPFADELGSSASGQSASMGSVSRYLAQMAALQGDWEAMETDFSRAMRRNMETRSRPEVAETRFDWATALLRRGLARDRERALALLEAAVREFTDLGMEPLRQRAADALGAVKAGPGHTLTDREMQVARLVAEGRSNKEVAGQLRLSVRTAENHLLNIMNKLGLDNRAQVAAWVTRTQAAEERR
jgi:DNA-binding CsgD family transcriptional regulator